MKVPLRGAPRVTPSALVLLLADLCDEPCWRTGFGPLLAPWAMPWTELADNHGAYPPWRRDLESLGDPSRWWVSAEAIRVGPLSLQNTRAAS